MKIQCSCGAKYAFDVTPDMARNPVRFVCPSCGRDSSDFVNQLVRAELAAPAASQPLPDAPLPSIASAPPPVPRLKISPEEKPAAAAPSATPAASKFCAKHPRERVTEKCRVCQKPICPKCMELFGYFCSPLCKSKAEQQGIIAPVYAGQKFAVEARFWRKTGLIAGSLAFVLVVALGAWIWYAWVGSVPHTCFSVRFEERSYFGGSQLVGADQLVFLHGGTLARYNLKTKGKVWSQELITPQQIADEITRENQLYGGAGTGVTADKQATLVRKELEAGLTLHVAGQNIWVRKPDRLTHYDWDSGKILQELPLGSGLSQVIARANEFLLLKQAAAGVPLVTHVNLTTGVARVEDLPQAGAGTIAAARNGAGGAAGGGLPLSPGADNGQPLDPQQVAAQAQNLNTPARIALPALLANDLHQQQIMAELKDGSSPKLPLTAPHQARERFTVVPDQNSFVELAVRLIESHLVERVAMKAPPKNSVLNGDLTASKTSEVANEMLNEMQRNRGGDKVEEDQSRYQVTLRRPESPTDADWTGEVIGPPALFPLKTVNVLTAGKTVTVFDKGNKKLWSATLTYTVPADGRDAVTEDSEFGAGPAAEHGDTLYVFDQAVLTAFDLTTGNARWRLPSVGVAGLFFDDQGAVYVNTTTANPDDIKYSRQIDVTKATAAVVFKLEAKTGKTLWSIKPGGFVSYVSGKFIYTIQSYDPGEEELDSTVAALQKPAYLRISRVDPGSGRIRWELFQERAPVDVQFNQNFIELVFKKEVQVLKYLTF